jgi:hypothetical protein
VASEETERFHLRRLRPNGCCSLSLSPNDEFKERLCVSEWRTEPSRRAAVSGWRMLGLYIYCLLLTSLAAALAAVLAGWPHWLPGLIP